MVEKVSDLSLVGHPIVSFLFSRAFLSKGVIFFFSEGGKGNHPERRAGWGTFTIVATGVIRIPIALRPFLSSDQEVTMDKDKDKKFMEALKTQAQTDCARLIRVAESHPICQHVIDRLAFSS